MNKKPSTSATNQSQPNWPSKQHGKPSGGARDNNPPKAPSKATTSKPKTNK